MRDEVVKVVEVHVDDAFKTVPEDVDLFARTGDEQSA
jgi:hypothetical protein